MNGKPFLDGGKGKVFQFSKNVSVARELNLALVPYNKNCEKDWGHQPKLTCIWAWFGSSVVEHPPR